MCIINYDKLTIELDRGLSDNCFGAIINKLIVPMTRNGIKWYNDNWNAFLMKQYGLNISVFLYKDVLCNNRKLIFGNKHEMDLFVLHFM